MISLRPFVPKSADLAVDPALMRIADVCYQYAVPATKFRPHIIALASVLLFATSSCSSDPESVTVRSVSITPLMAEVSAGDFAIFQLVAEFSDDSMRDVSSEAEWASGNQTLAVHQGAGAFETRASGALEFTGRFEGQVARATIVVSDPIALQAIAVSPSNASIQPDTTQQYRAEGSYTDGSTEDVTDRVTWSSSDTRIASVTAGLALGILEGETTISASLEGITGRATLVVEPPVARAIVLMPDRITIEVAGVAQITAVAEFADGSTSTITEEVEWSVEDDSVAAVSNAPGTKGQVTGLQVGLTSVSGLGPQGQITTVSLIEVVEPSIVSLAITPDSATLAVGETVGLVAEATLTDGSTIDATARLDWSSASDSIATVGNSESLYGVVTAIAEGTVVITATDVDTGVTGTSSFTITPAVLATIAVTPNPVVLAAGETVQLAAEGTLTDGQTLDLTASVEWMSSDPLIATVDAAGFVTTLTTGLVVISAEDPQTGIQSGAGSSQISVGVAALTSLAVSPTNPILVIGDAQQLNATGTFTDGSTSDLTSTVLWIANGAAVNISAMGEITALVAGTSTIVAVDPNTNIDSEQSGQSALATVIPLQLQSITVAPAVSNLPVGAERRLQATGTYNNNDVVDLSDAVDWTSDAVSIASVGVLGNEAGVVTAVASGPATITASDRISMLTGQAQVSVTATVTLVSLETGAPSLFPEVGSIQQLSADGLFSDGGRHRMTSAVTWASSNPTVGGVDNLVGARGAFTALMVGTTTVTATFVSDGTMSPPLVITVVPVPPVISFARSGDTTQYGNATGGSAFEDACPSDEVLVGLSADWSPFLTRLSARCGLVEVQADGAGGYDVVVNAGTILPSRGTASTSLTGTGTCAPNQVVVAFSSRTGLLVDRISLRCAPLLLAPGQSGYTVSLGAVTTPPILGGTGGTQNPLSTCGTDEVATVARIRAGASIDAFGLGCSQVQVAP